MKLWQKMIDIDKINIIASVRVVQCLQFSFLSFSTISFHYRIELFEEEKEEEKKIDVGMTPFQLPRRLN